MEFPEEYSNEYQHGKKSLRVHVDNVFRGHTTKSEHNEEQKEARERHQMFTEQHEALMAQNRMIGRSHFYTVLAAWAAVVAALASCAMAWLSLNEWLEKESPSKESPSIRQTTP